MVESKVAREAAAWRAVVDTRLLTNWDDARARAYVAGALERHGRAVEESGRLSRPALVFSDYWKGERERLASGEGPPKA